MTRHAELLLAIADNKARREEGKALGRAIRNALIVIGVPLVCLAWHYRFILPHVLFGA